MSACPSCNAENPEEQRFCGRCGAKLIDEPAREERKVITALFCDLVGSTALGERLDPEDVADLLRTYQGLCRRQIESYGGVVEKFIGDAVVGVFGVPAAHEDDPERAVRAALRMVDDIDAAELGIQVRIGVNTGEAVVRLDVDPRSGEGFATGDAMNTAARLEAAAPPMGVLVGEVTYAATSAQVAYEEVPPIDAKGKAEPVAAWHAVRVLARTGSGERQDRTPFVGRDLELSMLTQLFDRTRSRGTTEFVTIVADPGLGKSRLVRELRRHADATSDLITWREGRCIPYGEAVHLRALSDIVKAHAGILENDDRETVAAKLDRTIDDGDPDAAAWLRERLSPLVGLVTGSNAPTQEESFAAWRRYLETIAAGGPTVLVFEDLHWADAALISFLEHVAERMAGVPVLVVATARPELEERHPSWPPGRRSTVLSLSPLDDEDLTELIVAAVGERAAGLTPGILDRAGGSPLYAEQLVAMLAERATNDLDDGEIPASLQALIASRIDALTPELKQVLMEASVVGKTFWTGAVDALGSHSALADALGELVRREFLRPVHPSTIEGDDEFTFWHALVRDVAYAELTRRDRYRMHAATASWIEQVAPDRVSEFADVLAYHTGEALELATGSVGAADPDLVGDLEARTRRYLVLSGDRQMTLHAGRAAATYRAALDRWPPDDHGRVGVLVKAAYASLEAGAHRDAQAAFEEALVVLRARDDPGATGAALLGLAMVLIRTRELPHREVLDEALVLLEGAEPGRDLIRAYELKGFNEWFAGDNERGLGFCDRAVALAERLGLDAALPGPLGIRGSIRCDSFDMAGGIEDLKASLEQAKRAGLGLDAFGSYNNLGLVVYRNEGAAAATPIIEESVAWTRDHGLDEASEQAWYTWLESRLWTGDLQGFVDGVAELVASSRNLGIRALAGSELARMLLELDRVEEAIALSRTAVERTRVEEPHPFELQDVLRTSALVWQAAGEFANAASAIEEFLGLEERLGAPLDPVYLPDITRVASDAMLDEIEVRSGSATAKYRIDEAALETCRAVLHERRGEYVPAAAAYLRSAELWSPFSLLEQGHALLAAGRCLTITESPGAPSVLQRAKGVFEQMEATRGLTEARELLAKV